MSSSQLRRRNYFTTGKVLVRLWYCFTTETLKSPIDTVDTASGKIKITQSLTCKSLSILGRCAVSADQSLHFYSFLHQHPDYSSILELEIELLLFLKKTVLKGLSPIEKMSEFGYRIVGALLKSLFVLLIIFVLIAIAVMGICSKSIGLAFLLIWLIVFLLFLFFPANYYCS